MRKILIAQFLWIFSLFLAPHTYAQDEGWVVDNFHADIYVDKVARVTVVESIEVDFFDLQKHGIYRNIPVKYKDSYGNSFKLRFKTLDVTDQKNNKLKYQEYTEGNDVVLKIGHPNIFVTGKQTYVISYEVERALTTPHDETELYWNVTGMEWPVLIKKASASITGPTGSILEGICFVGKYGDVATCDKEMSELSADFSTTGLNSGEGLTFAVKLAKDKFIFPTRSDELKWFLKDNWLYLSPILTLLFMIWLYWNRGRDKEYQNIFSETGSKNTSLFAKVDGIMQFAPPENLSAGEVGLLVDERVQMRDITAVIIDLASRGYLKVRDIDKKGILSKDKIELINTHKKSNGRLLAFENSALDMLFTTNRKDKVILNDLHSKAYIHMDKMKKEMYKHMTSEGYFSGNPQTVRWAYIGISIAVMVIGNMLAATNFGGLIDSGGGHFAAVMSGLIVLSFSFFMPARTPKGRKALKEVVGLKEWIRIGSWRERIHEKKNFIEEVLPYTIAFGLTKKFIKALSEADLKNIDWYESNRPLTVNRFTNTVNAFEGNVSRAVAATRPSSSSSGGSGFSGGGSGGGFGGGGGGSW